MSRRKTEIKEVSRPAGTESRSKATSTIPVQCVCASFLAGQCTEAGDWVAKHNFALNHHH